jgi:hypothetical protein
MRLLALPLVCRTLRFCFPIDGVVIRLAAPPFAPTERSGLSSTCPSILRPVGTPRNPTRASRARAAVASGHGYLPRIKATPPPPSKSCQTRPHLPATPRFAQMGPALPSTYCFARWVGTMSRFFRAFAFPDTALQRFGQVSSWRRLCRGSSWHSHFLTLRLAINPEIASSTTAAHLLHQHSVTDLLIKLHSLHPPPPHKSEGLSVRTGPFLIRSTKRTSGEQNGPFYYRCLQRLSDAMEFDSFLRPR